MGVTAFSIRQIIDCVSFDDTLKNLEARETAQLHAARDAVLGALETLPVQDAPVFYHTLGFASSGKSTLLKYCREEKLFPEGVFYLGFDRLMEGFAPYRNDYAAFGAEEAFCKWELPARALGYDMLQQALRRKTHIVFEHSGARDDHVTLLETARNVFGYKIVVLELQCDPETALQRAALRPRFMPSHYVYERQKILEKLHPAYHRIADERHVYDTTSYPPVCVSQE